MDNGDRAALVGGALEGTIARLLMLFGIIYLWKSINGG